MIGMLRDMVTYLMQEKRWWLVPILVLLALMSFLLIALESSALAPFLYPLF